MPEITQAEKNDVSNLNNLGAMFVRVLEAMPSWSTVCRQWSHYRSLDDSPRIYLTWPKCHRPFPFLQVPSLPPIRLLRPRVVAPDEHARLVATVGYDASANGRKQNQFPVRCRKHAGHQLGPVRAPRPGCNCPLAGLRRRQEHLVYLLR